MALGDIKGELIADINKETKKGIMTNHMVDFLR